MQWLRTVRNGGKLYWKPKSTTDCSAREEEEEEEEEDFEIAEGMLVDRPTCTGLDTIA
jgi:hypothetical protein